MDYRALNKVTIKNKYLIPLAVQLFDRLSKVEYFTKLDLRSGYWQVHMAGGDEAKTTFVTWYGSFKFLVTPFGLTNAPATFCNLVIYSPTLEDHELYVKKEKCESAQTEIKFLGHLVSKSQILMDGAKVAAIRD